MVFAMSQRPLVLNEEEQKILKAFGRSSFSRKSNLAIESLLTPAQVDVAANHLAEKGLVKIKSSKNSESDDRVYLTWKGGQVKRKINKNVIEFPTSVEPNIDEKLKRQIACLKKDA